MAKYRRFHLEHSGMKRFVCYHNLTLQEVYRFRAHMKTYKGNKLQSMFKAKVASVHSIPAQSSKPYTERPPRLHFKEIRV